MNENNDTNNKKININKEVLPDEDKIKESLGKKIRRFRTSQDLTQEELANYTDLSSHTQIGAMERGKRNSKATTLYKMAKIFNTSIDYLIGLTEDKRSIDDIIDEKIQEKNISYEFIKKLMKSDTNWLKALDEQKVIDILVKLKDFNDEQLQLLYLLINLIDINEEKLSKLIDNINLN